MNIDVPVTLHISEGAPTVSLESSPDVSPGGELIFEIANHGRVVSEIICGALLRELNDVLQDQQIKRKVRRKIITQMKSFIDENLKL